MRVVRCENGHFYDSDKYSICPYCGNQGKDKYKEGENKYYYEFEKNSKDKKYEKCKRGHYYDSEKYTECPTCAEYDDLVKKHNGNQFFWFEEAGFLKDQTENYEQGQKLFQEGIYDLATEKLRDVVWTYTVGDKMRQGAFNMLKTMADSGNNSAQYECGKIYEEGGKGWVDPEDPYGNRIQLRSFTIVEKNYEKATYYYDEAIKNGNANAALMACYLYFKYKYETAPWKDNRKSLEYCIQGIVMESQNCLDKLSDFYICTGKNDKIFKLKQLFVDGKVDEAREYMQWLEQSGLFKE